MTSIAAWCWRALMMVVAVLLWGGIALSLATLGTTAWMIHRFDAETRETVMNDAGRLAAPDGMASDAWRMLWILAALVVTTVVMSAAGLFIPKKAESTGGGDGRV